MLFVLFILICSFGGGLIVGIVTYFLASEHADYDQSRISDPVMCSATLNDSYYLFHNRATKHEDVIKYQEWYYKQNLDSICKDILNPALYIEIIQYVLYIFMISFMIDVAFVNIKILAKMKMMQILIKMLMMDLQIKTIKKKK